jgi:hypothetical protein
MSSGEQDFERRLIDFEHSLGLPENVLPGDSEVKQLLNLPADAVEKMSSDECFRSAFILARYGLYLQRVVNREQAKARRAEENLKRLLAKEMPRIQAYSYEERRALAVSNSDSAKEIEKERMAAQTKLELLAFLTKRVDGLSSIFESALRRNR